MASAELDTLGSENHLTTEAEFADAPHHLIPPQLAPAQFQEGIGRFLEGHTFDQNVFYMSRYPLQSRRDDPIGAAIEACRDACRNHGLELHVASDRAVSDLLFGNIAAGMWASKYGIAIFENRVNKGLNYNATLEVGGMLVTGRRCLLLKDVSADALPTDLVGHIYKTVDIGQTDSVRRQVQTWLTDDLGIAPGPPSR
jgi:hypothetical protein